MSGGTRSATLRAPSLLGGLWRCRWNVVRIAVAALLVAVLVADLPAALAWLQYRVTPSIDYVAKAENLAKQERFDEAVAVLKAGLEDPDYASRHRDALEAKLAEIERERNSWTRRARSFFTGAITGYGRRPEALAGAIVADFFVVGDVRDLAIEGYKYISDGDSNELILALSAIGVVTTVAPYFDLGPAILKLAAKTGAMSRKLFDKTMDLARLALRGEKKPLLAFAGDVATLARHGGGATAIHALKHVDDPAELAKLARYTERNGQRAAFVMHVLEEDAARALVRRSDDVVEEAVLLAARKGDAGKTLLRSGKWRVLIRPHPLIGLTKGIAKGNVQRFLAKVTQGVLRPYFYIALPAALAWLGLELVWLRRRLAAYQSA